MATAGTPVSLQHRPQPAPLHHVQRFDGIEVFGEQWAGGFIQFCILRLKRFGQRHQSLNRLVVGFADFLSLVRIHIAEDLAESCVGGLIVDGDGYSPVEVEIVPIHMES